MTAYFEMFPMQVIALAPPCPVKRASVSTLKNKNWTILIAETVV